MGLFFVRAKHHLECLERAVATIQKKDDQLRDLRIENNQLKGAIAASREAFDKAAPVQVVHTWTTA